MAYNFKRNVLGRLDPGNLFGFKGNPFTGATAGLPAYTYDPTAYELGTAGRDLYGQMANTYAARSYVPEAGAGQAMGMLGTAAGSATADQRAALGMLRTAAEGGAPSAAEIQMQQGLQQQQAQLVGALSANPNMAPGLAAYLGAQQNTALSQNTLAQTAMLRAQEQEAARQAYMSGASQVDAQRIQGASAYADTAVDYAGMLAQYQQQTQADNDAMVRYFTSLGMNEDEANRRVRMALEADKAAAYSDYAQRQWGTEMAKRGYVADTQHAATGMAAGMAGTFIGRGGQKQGGATGKAAAEKASGGGETIAV